MKTKKILALGLAILMATSVFGVMSISAKDAFTPDDNLIYHWDFEGEGDEVLANKAPGAAAAESMTLKAGTDETKIEDGIAKIGNGNTNSISFAGDATKGAKLNGCQSEYTLIFRMAIADPENWGSVGSQQPYFIRKSGSNNTSDAWLMGTGYSAGTTKLGYRPNWGSIAWCTTSRRLTGYNTQAITVKTNQDGTATWTVFVNGEQVYTVTYTPSARIMSCWATLTFSSGDTGDWGVDAYYDDIRIYNKALNADEVGAVTTTMETPDVKDEAVVFEGVQFRNATETTYDIRFVAKIAADNYTELGFDYDLAKWTGDGADKLTASYDAKCETAYRYLAYGDSYYDAGEGYYYISFTLEGIELTDAADYFEATLTAYGVTEEGTQYSDTYKMTAIDGASCVFALVADN